MADNFNGSNAKLCGSIDALLSLDAAGALVPHGIGGHARTLLESAATRIRALESLRGGGALTDTYVQEVPDKCDRIIWRGHYHHLPIKTTPELPEGEAAAEQYRKAHNAGEAHGRIMAALESSQPAAVQGGRWPFVESPGEFTARLEAAMREFPLIGAVRHVLIENPPTLAAAPQPQGRGVATGDTPTFADVWAKLQPVERSIISIYFNETRGTPPASGGVLSRSIVESVLTEVLHESDDSLSVGTFDEIVNRLSSPTAASGGVDAAHIANEWADMATNGVQWLRNIRDGISTADDALTEMESNYRRIIAISATPSPTSARELPELPKPSKRERHWDGEIVSEWFTADQMRAYALQAREGK